MDHNVIPVVAIISNFVFILGIVFAALYFSYQKRKFLHGEILAAIEKGMDIPLPQPKKANYRNRGIIYTLTGFVLALALWVTTGSLMGFLWGLIPMALGIAYLIISRGENNSEQDPEKSEKIGIDR